MQKRQVKILSALAIAGLAGVSGLANTARAGVTLTQGYLSGQISSTSNFASGTITAVTLSTAGPNTVSLQPGQFFRFGVSEVTNGTVNPIKGDAWDNDNVNNQGNSEQPATLGLLGIAMNIGSTNPSGSLLSPLNAGGNTSTAITIDQAGTIMGWSSSSPGDINGGLVGDTNQISGGANGITNATLKGNSTNIDAPLTDFLAGGPPGGTNAFFTKLEYKANGTGSVTLSPAIFSNGTQYWVATDLGTVGGNPAQYAGQFFGPNDTISPLAPITVNIAAVPEPASLGLLSVGGLALLARRSRKARA